MRWYIYIFIHTHCIQESSSTILFPPFGPVVLPPFPGRLASSQWLMPCVAPNASASRWCWRHRKAAEVKAFENPVRRSGFGDLVPGFSKVSRGWFIGSFPYIRMLFHPCSILFFGESNLWRKIFSSWLYHMSIIYTSVSINVLFPLLNHRRNWSKTLHKCSPNLRQSGVDCRFACQVNVAENTLENEWLKPNWLLMVQKSQTPTWDVMYKTFKNMGYSPNLNWCSPDSWTINRITQFNRENTVSSSKTSILMWVFKRCVNNPCRWLAFQHLLMQRGKKTSSSSRLRSEVPGSPIFMMQLCSGARHIEVQIVGDQLLGVFSLNESWKGWKANLKDRYNLL